MKHKTFFVITLMAIVCSSISCNENYDTEAFLFENSSIDSANLGLYERQFSIILSKAIYESEPLRTFIKDEAIKQFDNDFDVLYGMVKDTEVIEGQSFRELLLLFCESEKQLTDIENALPLLNIFVPDVSWLSKDGFSARTWDIADNEIVVTYRDNNNSNEYFGNGEVVCKLADNQIPSFPTLVVKNNERMVVCGNTRSGMKYEFKSNVYNGALTKGGTHNYNGTVVPAMVGNSPTVSASQLRTLSQRAYNAYTEFGSNSSVACQRDYCYYQMTNNNLTNGILQRNVYEKLYRFKFNINNISVYDDDSGDPLRKQSIDTSAIYYKGENDIEELAPDIVQVYGALVLASDFFSEGNLEIVVTCIYHSASGQTYQTPYYFTISPYELFEFNDVRFYYLHSSFWRKAKYTYVYDKNNIVPKWYYPETDIYFFNWGLGSKAVDYCLEIMEQDSGDTITTTESFSFSFSNNINQTSDGVEYKTTTGVGTTTAYGCQISRSHSENSDVIARPVINYAEDFILNRTISGNDTLYTLRNYDNNVISVCIVPAEMY